MEECAVAAGLVKPHDPESTSRKLSKYVPFWRWGNRRLFDWEPDSWERRPFWTSQVIDIETVMHGWVYWLFD